MRDLPKGFWIGERFVPWGTTLAEACRLLGVQPGEGCDIDSEAWMRCTSAYGFGAVSAQVRAPKADRPVTSVDFELASAGTRTPDPEYWAGPLSERFGAPAELSRTEIPDSGDPADCVAYYAHWDLADSGVGLSVYGGLREAAGGRSAGTLWLSWSELLAADPYLEEWRGRVARLAALAEQPSELRTFVLEWRQNAQWLPTDATPAAALARRRARICLYSPTLLDTPDKIAARLTPKGFAVWRNEPEGFWCVSTRYDSMMFPLGQPVPVTRIELQPAKGGGYSELEIDCWRVQGRCGSPAIREAAEILGRIPGVTLKQETGYDC